MNINKKFAFALPAIMALGLGSCTSYLDKAPDSDVDPEEAFASFVNFQGYVEDNYRNIPQVTTSNWNISWNYGEDEILSTNGNSPYVTYNFDLGDFRAYFNNWGGGFTHMYGPNTDHSSNDRFAHHILNDAWYCIRECNTGLANLGFLANATDEEKNAIAGQLYFFRAWWHAEMLYYMGGLPYIDHLINGSETMNFPRLSVQETALKCAEDFGKAAELLPDNWDNTELGATNNELRITRATAMAYQGKLLLWAASPLAEHGAQTGASTNDLTYKYNTEYAKKSAEVLGNCIDLLESGATPYELASYDYADLYEHTPNASATNIFYEIFWTQNKNWLHPGGKEAMMRGIRGGINGARWGEATNWGPNVNKLCDGGFCIAPTANYVHYAYGMADGTHFEDALKEDPEVKKFPFKNRDKRFYHDIIIDGCKYIKRDLDMSGADSVYKDLVYCSLYTGGLMRDETQGSRSGYLCQKFFPHTCNHLDEAYGYGVAGQSYLPWMRVAEVYLMYAEALAATDGPNASAGATNLSAVDAINVLRDRVGTAHVLPRYMSDNKTFMEEVRRERACELAFEMRRMPDLMRWLLITEKPYTIKTSVEFSRKNDAEWYKTNSPYDAEVVNFHEEPILERAFTAKHYFWPWQDKHVYIYADFPQNPGW